MSKSIFKQTDLENLISNLRGEVGEIIQSWSLMRDFYILSAQMQTEDISQDMENQDLAKVNLIKKKFQNDIISNTVFPTHVYDCSPQEGLLFIQIKTPRSYFAV